MKKIGIFSFLFPFLFMILMSVNKLTKKIYFLRYAKFLFLHFLFFLFFLFFCFGGWAQLSPHGLGWSPLTRLGHWSQLVTRLPNELQFTCYSSKWIIIHCYCSSELNCKGERRGTTYLVQQGVAGDDDALC
jgi:hypothetical protein